MDKQVVLAIIIISIVLMVVLIVVLFRSNLINFIAKFFVKTRKNELSFFRQYEISLDYSKLNRFRRISIEKLLKIFKKHTTGSTKVNIRMIFNGNYYASYDLDLQSKLTLFKQVYSATPYVLFKSSEGKHWGLVDIPYKKLKDIFVDHNWNICNDQQYVSYTKHHRLLVIRGLYKNFDRKPTHIYTNKILSKNFQLFIDKLVTYYSKEGLEMSILKYQDPEMLIKFNRKRKLELLNEKEKGKNT